MQETQSLQNLLDMMWKDYCSMTPQALKIVNLIEKRGEKIVNDHIALRTFNHQRVGIEKLAKIFKDFGYKAKGEYHFEEKKLYARHFEHEDSELPKIFISELLLEKFSAQFREIVHSLIEQVKDEDLQRFDFTCMGRPWNLKLEDYESLKKESEYGAWMSAIGYRPNHFTLLVNELKSFPELKDLNSFLKDNGFKLNDSDGEIKGSPQVLLEQSSTLADSMSVDFLDSSKQIPTCYFEFAKRYPQQNGQIYQGFVAASADKIFESTDRSQ